MKLKTEKYLVFSLFFIPLLLSLSSISFGQKTRNLSGNIVDQFNGNIVGANVILTYENPNQKTLDTVTDENGKFNFTNIKETKFKLKINKTGFRGFESEVIDLDDGAVKFITITLELKLLEEKVEIDENSPESTLSNISVTTLRQDEIDSLPEQREALEAAIRALSPFGDVEIVVDGVAGKKIPPKSAIKEIKVITGSFSTEFQDIRGGRIQIITKIGSTTLNGSISFSYGNSHLNAIDPLTNTISR